MFTSEATDKVALVIGNDDYTHAPKLKNARNDALAVAKMLEEEMGFTLVTGKGGKKTWTDVSTDEFYDAMDSFEKMSEGAKLGLFYFAGHGMEVEKKNFLIPVDAELERESQLRSQAIELGDILSDMKKADYPAKLIILDCCRDNPLTRSWTRTRSLGKGLAAISDTDLPSATMIMFSAAPGQPALDGQDGNSPFTEALLRELPKPRVSALEAFFQVSDSVVSSTGKRQEPWVKFDGAGRTFRLFSLGQESKPVANRSQALKIGVVDMQVCLNDFWKTTVEVDKINARADTLRVELDALHVEYKNLDGEKRTQKGKEIEERQKEASAEILKTRQDMEVSLVAELKDSIAMIRDRHGFDLMFDRSFLPKANKFILYTEVVPENGAIELLRN